MQKLGYPIRIVAERTGLSPHVIRIWEKRYQLIHPQRSHSKQRLYDEEAIYRLQLLKNLTHSFDLKISRLASCSISELELLLEEEKSKISLNKNNNECGIWLEKAKTAVNLMDMKSLKNTLNYASVYLTHSQIVEDIIVELLNWIGQRWAEGSLNIANEHIASSTIAQFLQNMREDYPKLRDAPCVLVTTLPKQTHELGALLFSVIAAQEGWNVLYCGTEMPAEEIVTTAVKMQVDFIALSLVYPADDETVHAELQKLLHTLPKNLQVILGGSSAKSYEKSITCNCYLIDNLNNLRSQLREQIKKSNKSFKY